MACPGIGVRNQKAPGFFTSAISRVTAFFGFWLLLTDAAPADLAVGVVAACAASFVSLRLLPAEQWQLRPVAIAKFVAHFLGQSIAAGTGVALRALDPRLPLQPGFKVYQTHLPPGLKRNAFCAITSLIPGTLPCGPADRDGLTIHCIDMRQPVVEQLAAEETLCIRTFGSNPPHE